MSVSEEQDFNYMENVNYILKILTTCVECDKKDKIAEIERNLQLLHSTQTLIWNLQHDDGDRETAFACNFARTIKKHFGMTTPERVVNSNLIRDLYQLTFLETLEGIRGPSKNAVEKEKKLLKLSIPVSESSV